MERTASRGLITLAVMAASFAASALGTFALLRPALEAFLYVPTFV